MQGVSGLPTAEVGQSPALTLGVRVPPGAPSVIRYERLVRTAICLARLDRWVLCDQVIGGSHGMIRADGSVAEKARPPIDGGTVLITGASAGIGREFAAQIAPRAGALICWHGGQTD